MNDKASKNDTDDDSRELFKRLEKSLHQIEIDEIRRGLSKNELEEKGFLGKKEIEIEKKIFAETTEREKLSFKPGIEYERLPDDARFELLDIESLLFIKDVLSGMLIATREPNETIKFNAGKNVTKKVTEEGEKYFALKKGKVVIIKDTMHVFPSGIDCRLEIRISDDKMHVYMDCKDGYGDGKKLTADLVMDELEKMHVMYGINKQNIQKALDEAERNLTQLKDIVIAEGTPPVTGADGKIKYCFKNEEDKLTFRILPDGRVDYKGSANISTTKKEQLIATIEDPGTGITGMNVLGEVNAAEKGKEAYLIAGKGVRASEDGKSFYAEITGCVVPNPPILEVLELYEVRGDVDYSTGNIAFSGNVIINGTVREGFEVKADGDIIIQNCVEPSRIIAGRDIRISGGIIGQGKGLISAGRDVYAEYVQNGKIEAQGTVYINDFAVNSYISCNRLDMLKKHGSIVGGEAFARRYIDVLSIGSHSGTKTYVTAGTDFLVRKKIKEIDAAIEFYADNLKKIDAMLKPALELLKSDPENPRYNKTIIQNTIQKRKELKTQQLVMEAKRKNLYEQMNVEGVCYIKVKHACYADVNISIKDLKHPNTIIRENVRFYEDRKDSEIKVGPY